MPAMTPPMTVGSGPGLRCRARSSDERSADDDKADDRQRDAPARQRAPARLGCDLEGDRDIAREGGPQFPRLLVESPQAFDAGTEDRQRVGRRMGRGQERDWSLTSTAWRNRS